MYGRSLIVVDANKEYSATATGSFEQRDHETQKERRRKRDKERKKATARLQRRKWLRKTFRGKNNSTGIHTHKTKCGFVGYSLGRRRKTWTEEPKRVICLFFLL